jgi:polyhydroxyalkanoate synthesis regulator phasin
LRDLISRALLCGMGLASLTTDALRKTAEDLVDQSKLSEAEGRKLVKELQRRSAEAEKAMEKRVETAVNKVLKKLNVRVVHGQPKKAAGKSRRGHARKA